MNWKNKEFDIPWIGESLVAHVTLEGFLASVNSSTMFGQLMRKQKSFATPLASMRTFVGMTGFLMQQELVASDKGFATLSAVEGSNTRMQGHVVLETARSLETARTL